MRGYWRIVFSRAWREAAEAVGLGSPERVIIALFIQAIISGGIWLATGSMSGNTLWTRVLTVAAPFMLFPLLFLWRLPQVPPAMAREDQERIATLEPSQDRKIVREQLGQFIFRAERMKALCRTGSNQESLEQLISTTEEWLRELNEFTNRHFDGTQRALLFSDAGILSGEPSMPDPWIGRWRWLNYRVIRLQQLADQFL